MTEGPRPLVDAEELSWAVRIMLGGMALLAGAFGAGVMAGLCVQGYRLVGG